jgi:hypothetical protein
MSELAERPIFVVGSPRSGTTLLRFILSSHPRLHIPSETGFLPYLGEYAGTDLDASDVRAILERVGRLNREWASMVDDARAFYQSLPEPSLACVLDGLYRIKCAPFGAERWGDKTPAYVLHMFTLAEMFPSAQFVHLIRDGRDATLSAQRKWGEQAWYMDNYYLLRNWVRYVERGRVAGQKLGSSRYLEVRYEALVTQPKAVVERLCAFLGEELHPDMLDHTRLAQQQIGPRDHVEVREPVSQASVGRWRLQMSAFDQKLADRVAGSTLASLGYELAGQGSLTTGESVRLALLSVKFMITNSARGALRALGFLALNRGKRSRR